MILKKWIIFVTAILLLVTFSACGMPNWQNESGAPEEENSAASQKEVNQEDYEDSLNGLCDYLAALGYIDGEKTEMNAQMIGASAGEKYSFTVEKSGVSVELYEFDPENLDETGKEVLQSVKEEGKFSILGTEVEAILSDSGKYIMIYMGSRSNETVQAERTAAIDAFKVFKS